MTQALSLPVALAGAAFVFRHVPVQSSDGIDRRFLLQNSGDTALWAVHAMPVGSPSWGPDILRDTVLTPRAITVLQPAPELEACFFALRFTWTDGTAVEAERVNLCEEYALVASRAGVQVVRSRF